MSTYLNAATDIHRPFHNISASIEPALPEGLPHLRWPAFGSPEILTTNFVSDLRPPIPPCALMISPCFLSIGGLIPPGKDIFYPAPLWFQPGPREL